MQPSKLRNCVGKWVSGDDFFDREFEQEQLEKWLLSGHHVSLIAQRRTGKTSLLRQVAANLQGRATCLYVDLQDAKDAADAIVSITLATRSHQRLWTKARAAFKNALGAIEVELRTDELSLKLRESLLGSWSLKGDRILDDLASAETPVVLLLDELPVLLVRLLEQDRSEAETFLSWLRRACLQHGPRLCVVVTGSIGLGPIASRAGLSGTLNHYTPMILEPWSPHIAVNCLHALARKYEVTFGEEAAEEVVAQLGSCIPYHVQLFFSLLEEDARRHHRETITPLDVERVYHRRMLSTHGHVELAHMEERLRLMVRPQHHALTLDLLTEAAVVGALTPKAGLSLTRDHGLERREGRSALLEILSVLEHDGYLESVDGAHRFASKLLKEWWSARFSTLYLPAAERSP
ncbi:MAG: ATP-binding protein [Alphaproteobacteria bacterium]|nr:ATP-binding protein [Alphaproteobacteria bacterium]